MIVSEKHKFVFIKTRKVAGSSLEKCLYPHLGENDVCTGGTRGDNYPRLNYPKHWHTHLSMKHLYNNVTSSSGMNSDIRDNYFKFTIERNPWDKMVSFYFWYQKTHPELFERHASIRSFSGFLENSQFDIVNDLHMYMDKSYENVIVDRIYKYEELDRLFNKLSKMGIDIREDFVKTRLKEYDRPGKDYRKMYKSYRDVLTVQKRFYKVIEMLGYEYDG